MDFGKRNILRCLADAGCKVTSGSATASAEDVRANRTVFSSLTGRATGGDRQYAVPVISQLIKFGIPMFGICLGHQLLSLALAPALKMHLGHRGANHGKGPRHQVESPAEPRLRRRRGDPARRRGGEPRVTVRRQPGRHPLY